MIKTALMLDHLFQMWNHGEKGEDMLSMALPARLSPGAREGGLRTLLREPGTKRSWPMAIGHKPRRNAPGSPVYLYVYLLPLSPTEKRSTDKWSHKNKSAQTGHHMTRYAAYLICVKNVRKGKQINKESWKKNINKTSKKCESKCIKRQWRKASTYNVKACLITRALRTPKL